jgi:hypothetical protein
MKSTTLNTLAALTLLFSASIAIADRPATISCGASLPAHAATGHKDLLPSGGYGFCQIDTCDPSYELSKNKCLPPPSLSWFSIDRSIQSGDYTLAVYAQLNRASTGTAMIDISTALSTATASDFELLTPQAVFNSYQYSEPILVRIKRTAGNLPSRTISLKLSNVASGSAVISAANEITFTISSQNSQPIELTAGDATVTAGSPALVSVDLSAVRSKSFPTFISARYHSGDRTAIQVLQVDSSIPANSTHTLVSIPTTDRDGGSQLSIEFSVRSAGDVIITKSISTITINAKPKVCSSGFHPSDDNNSCVANAGGISCPAGQHAFSAMCVPDNSGVTAQLSLVGDDGIDPNAFVIQDNVLTMLDQGIYKSAISISFDGSDTYITGEGMVGSGSAHLWTNGIRSSLGSTGGAYASVKVGSDLYVAGLQTLGGYPHPVRWTNGARADLPEGGADFGNAIAMAALGGSVYTVGGEIFGTVAYPALWTNSTLSFLDSTGYSAGRASAITVSGSDIVIAGSVTQTSSGSAQPAIWTNGALSVLSTAGYHYGGVINGIAVSGGNVVAVGEVTGDITYGCVWINGEFSLLDKGSFDAVSPIGVKILNGDVYIGGVAYDVSSNSYPAVWKNGVLTAWDNQGLTSMTIRGFNAR